MNLIEKYGKFDFDKKALINDINPVYIDFLNYKQFHVCV